VFFQSNRFQNVVLRSFRTDHRATLVQFKSSGPTHLTPEKEKGGSSAIAEETAHFPTTHYKA
jgi:hypothetical protein